MIASRKETFKLFCSSFIVIFLLLSCATTITTRMVTQLVLIGDNKKDVLDAITFVLSDNGFDIAMVNETYGICNTAWRPVQSGADTAATILSITASALSRGPSSYSTFSREMMISVQLLENGYKIIPKVKRISSTTSIFATTERDDISYPTQDSAEGKLVNKLITEINQLLHIPDDYVWEEKEISIEDPSL